MTDQTDLIVFSDLDGTLLDHDSYSWAPAASALRALRRIGAGVVLASSKTAAEIAPLRQAIGFADWPAIVENGGGLLAPGQGAETAAGDYPALRARLAALPPGFRGFGDMSATEIAAATGLSRDAALLAQARQFSEPGRWTGPEAELPGFLQAAAEAGLTAQQGGRFLTLSFGGTKADRVAGILAERRPRHSLALGDAPNDVAMLQRTEFGVIVRNDHAPPLPTLPGEASGHIRRTGAAGPEGWAEAVLALLDELKLTKEPTSHG
ncbi:HAD-IIB family hydrolase [Pseudodonghicola flavimaris]|uniref:HAD-IIB family hydrolase n=1 Tax=Pseudodonghicola flavimaris TaxID=3050036 RepID=A0ABT7F5J4_9RHOB|nr:HAD-IIB family hydrolase [Pseudodonghicola flavimaris]MDK3019775.1 HAD-IIB family hydrolase [Pseudodonghicola flavimaris]